VTTTGSNAIMGRLMGDGIMRVFPLLIAALAAGCASGPYGETTVIRNLDFDEDVLHRRIRSALEHCFARVEQPAPNVFATGYQIIAGEGADFGFEYANRAVLRLVAHGLLFDLYIRADKYGRKAGVYQFEDEGWRHVRRSPETEEKVRKEIMAEIEQDRRVRRGHDEIMRLRRGW